MKYAEYEVEKEGCPNFDPPDFESYYEKYLSDYHASHDSEPPSSEPRYITISLDIDGVVCGTSDQQTKYQLPGFPGFDFSNYKIIEMISRSGTNLETFKELVLKTAKELSDEKRSFTKKGDSQTWGAWKIFAYLLTKQGGVMQDKTYIGLRSLTGAPTTFNPHAMSSQNRGTGYELRNNAVIRVGQDQLEDSKGGKTKKGKTKKGKTKRNKNKKK